MTEIVILLVQVCIGLVFAIYGICSLLRNRSKKGEQTSEKSVLFLVCVLVGIFLLGYVVYHVLQIQTFQAVAPNS